MKIHHKSTSDPQVANEWLSSIDVDIIACDFETSSIYTDEDKSRFTSLLPLLRGLRYHEMNQRINSSGLSHPKLSRLTHFSLATSDTDALVFIIDSQAMQDLILTWLVSTEVTQIWHNASFDFRHIYYHTHKFPLNYEDSSVLAKTILNDVNTQKALVSLKHLMGYKYGDWAISSDNFHQSQMYEEHVLKYAAIDACATFALWNDMQQFLKDQ